VRGVLFDLLMAVMDSLSVWTEAAGGGERGIEWRDAVTARMMASSSYAPYEPLVAEGAAAIDLPIGAADRLVKRWAEMVPWPDAASISGLSIPYAFVTNCSGRLAGAAARRSGLEPRFVLSAEEAGRYKPHPAVYREACRRLGTDPAATMFVAGSPYDAAGARAAGLRSTLVVRRPDHHADDATIIVVASLHDAVSAIDPR